MTNRHDAKIAKGEETGLVLPCGVTGFYDPKGTPPPRIDFRSFVTACHTAARIAGGKVTGTAQPYTATVNAFGGVAVALPDRTIEVLVNAHFPFVAFAEPRPAGGTAFTFVDEPSVAATLAACGEWRPLTKSQLDGPITLETLAALSPAELGQVRGWKPRSLGEVVFNFWD